MARTCHRCRGRFHKYDQADLKRCAGCQKVYYCSTACQKYDWVEHIFDCRPKRPINTADHLALSVRKDFIPGHPQTCKDYGFDRASTADDRLKLFGLYICLIQNLNIPPQTIHDWRVRGVLADEIKAVFFKYPEYSRGICFSWFLQNEHVVALAGQPLSGTEDEQEDLVVTRAWQFIGRNEGEPTEVIINAIARKSIQEQQCFWLYVLLLSGIIPGPNDIKGLWINFGFASCVSVEAEKKLGSQYLCLIEKCTFLEFCDAYREGRLLEHFHSVGLQVANSEHFHDIVRGSVGRKSVWLLKRFVLQEDGDEREPYADPVMEKEYGFINCQNLSERRRLKRVYKAYFETHGGDPILLHEAVMQGDIYGFLSKQVRGLRDSRFQQLMKNTYSLPNV